MIGNSNRPMTVFDIAGRAMSAQLVRLNTTASNLANAGSVSTTRAGAGADRGRACLRGQVGHIVGIVDRIDNAHWPSLKVSRVRVFAVCRTCTLFWYWRAVSTMSISSAAVSTPASQTSPFASAKG